MSDRQQRLARLASKEVARAEARLDALYNEYLTGGHEVCFNGDMSTSETRPQQAWRAIPADFKVVKNDGTRWVLAWDPAVGTVLVPWVGAS